MTIAEAIERWNAKHAAPMTALTPLGTITSTLFKLKRQVRALGPEDRAIAIAQLRAVLADLEQPATTGPQHRAASA